jgi:hypothetical protein
MDPVRADITPRAGDWIEASRIRSAIKSAGFKPGEIVYTVTGRLADWHGQPALAIAGSDRLVLLQPEPKSPQAYEQVRQAASETGERTVEVEGAIVDRAPGADATAPSALRVRRFAVPR